MALMLRQSSDTEPGYTRKRNGRYWQYFGPDGERITDREEIDRLNAVGMPGSDGALSQVVEAMRPWSAGSYLNFAERPTDDAFDSVIARRLAAVKAAWDPEGRFLTRR